jgi:uncharacterized protein YecT (DUF1311 family)
VIIIFLVAAAAAATPDCHKLRDAIAKDQCFLSESTLDAAPNCSNQMTQYDMNVCSFRDFLRVDIDMNRAWGKAATFAKAQDKDLRSSDPKAAGEFNRLLSSQRKWNAFKEAQCDVEAGPRETGGSMWAMNLNWCLKKLTDARIAQLREYVEPKN